MAGSGCCLPRRISLASFAHIIAFALILSGGQGAAARRRDSRPPTINLAAGTLADALRQIAAQTGSEIISIEPGLAARRIAAQQLRGETGAILASVLRGTDLRPVRLSPTSYRIERRPSRRDPPPRGQTLPTEKRPADIVVTASKFPVPLAQYPGSVVQMIAVTDDDARLRGASMDELANGLPAVQRTELGTGRNKSFIRGIADSSFNGSTQSTASIYFGDALLGFGSPSPSLQLYDIANVEVLEGPQGTLYGSGSMGGVIHISPNPVNLDTLSGSTALGGSGTVGGQPGWDMHGMVNVPLVEERVGMRAVAYHDHEGGYITNLAVGQDSNAVNVTGGRLALSARIGDSSRVDAGVLYQATNGNDAPYVRGDAGSLRRRAMIAEPYASKLVLGYLTFERAWDSGVKLTSVTSLGSRSSFDVFDSTPRPTAAPVAYQIDRGSTMFAQEIRLARRSDGGLSWVAGMTYQRARDGLTRSLGMPEEPTELDEVTNTTYAASLFGQATLSLSSGVSATLGLRWTAARTDSEPSRDTRALIRGIDTRRTDPTAALAWRVAPHGLLYARVQTSYRNGGMAVERGVGRVANFAADSIVMGEAGVRRLRSGTRGLSASMAVSYTHWADIQADLITR
ncbi:MAG: TonB-dependent receptor, partial [Sphingobium sp.]